MEGLDSASNNNSQQQPTSNEATSFISNLTAVAPISSSDVDDFQSDSKWDVEFTPLEKASLDCIEMESAAFDPNNEQQMDQNLVSPSQDQTKFEGTSTAEESVQQESIGQDSGKKVSEGNGGGVCGIESVDLQQLSNMNELDNIKDDNEQRVVFTEEIIETAQSSEVENIITVPNVFTIGQSGNASINSNDCNKQTKKSVSTSEGQQNTFSTKPESSEQHKITDARDDISTSNDATVQFFSQASVDDQMEKVIDNVVELGGGQHFGQILGRSEDKAKVLESIHREITSDRSSMEIMADIALQQLPLVTDPTTSPTTNVYHVEHRAVESQQTKGSASIKKSSERYDLTTTSTKPQQEGGIQMKAKQETLDEAVEKRIINLAQQSEIINDDCIFSSSTFSNQEFKNEKTIETFVEEASSSSSIPSDSRHIEPIVDEPQPAESLDSKEKQSVNLDNTDSTLEPVKKVDEQKNELHLNSVTEQVFSAEESDDVVPADVAHLPKSLDEGAANEESKVTIEQNLVPESEPSRRRSGRARVVKVIDKDEVETTPKVDAKKTTARMRGSARKLQKEEIVASKDLPPEDKIVETEQNRELMEPERTESESDNAHEQELETTHKIEEELEKLAEPARSARSVRIRVPKKLLEDSSPKEELAKKQVKRSRLNVDSDHNKSYEAAKNTPMIKLPTQRSRATISTSNPSARPTPPSHKRKRSPSPDANDSSIEKKYTCSECNFSTDRLNNVVFHYTKSYCPGKCQMVEDMKADIIKQQQTPKGNKNKRLAR